MRILKVYLDTSVISYLDQQDAPEKMLETQSLWRQLKSGKYAVVISDMVIQEINECQPEKRERLLSYLKQIDYSMIRLTDEIRALANKILNMGILTKKSTDDAVHIASAISVDCDIIILEFQTYCQCKDNSRNQGAVHYGRLQRVTDLFTSLFHGK